LYDCLATVLDISSPAQAAPEVPRARKLLPNARILVAEDNAVNQRVLLRLLDKIKCRVDVAANGLEALEAIKRLPYDLILSDCQRPEMDGFTATRMIRNHENSQGETARRIPIVALTANAMQGDRAKCLEAGMDDYLAKPVNADLLFDMIEHWIGLNRTAAGSS